MVDHVALAAGSGTLHLLQGMTVVDGYQQPLALRSRPAEGLPADHRRHVGHGLLTILLKGHHLIERGIALGRCYVEGEDGRAVGTQRRVLGYELARCVGHLYRGTTERPASSAVHVDVNAVLNACLLAHLKSREPSLGEVAQFVLLVARNAVDRRYLQRAYTRAGIVLHVPPQVIGIYGRSHPPPARPGLGFAFHLGPGGDYLCCCLSKCQHRHCPQGNQSSSSHIFFVLVLCNC